jgi:hypothetical protein
LEELKNRIGGRKYLLLPKDPSEGFELIRDFAKRIGETTRKIRGYRHSKQPSEGPHIEFKRIECIGAHDGKAWAARFVSEKIKPLTPEQTADLLLTTQDVNRRTSEALKRHAANAGTTSLSQTITPATACSRPKLTKEEANIKVREYLTKHHDAKIRDLPSNIGCSVGLIAKTPAWKAFQAAKKEGRQPKKSKTVRLTSKSQKIIGTEDLEVQRLINEQKADSEPSPLENTPEPVKVYGRR